MSYIDLLFNKTRKNRLNIIPFLIIVLFIIILYIGNHIAAYFEITNPEYSGEQELIQIDKDILIFQDEINKNEKNSEEYQFALENLHIAEQRKSLIQQRLDAVEDNNWKEYYKNDLELTRIALETVKADVYSYGDDLIEVLYLDQLYTQYMLDNNMGYDERFAPTQGVSYMVQIANEYLPLLMSTLLVFMTSIIFCTSYRNNINIHSLLPISHLKRQVFNLVTGTLIGVFIVIFIGLVAYICGLFGNCSGDLNTPILLYSLQGSEQYVSFLSVFLQVLMLLVLSIFFIVNLVSFVSLLTRKNMPCLLFALIIIIGSMWVVTEFVPLHPIIHILPITYLNLLKVISGEFSFLTGNENINFLNGVIVLIVYNILLFMISNCIHKYRIHKVGHIL